MATEARRVIAGAVTTIRQVIASPGSIWQAGEPNGDCSDGGVEDNLNLGADAGGTSQTPLPF